jgi:hypothetical protein
MPCGCDYYIDFASICVCHTHTKVGKVTLKSNVDEALSDESP